MFGKDINRILTSIDKIKDTASQQLAILVQSSVYQIETEEHEHTVIDHALAEKEKTYEKEQPSTSSSYVSPIVQASGEFFADHDKMKTLESRKSKPVTTFNTEYGSPYTETYKLKEKIDELEKYATQHPELKWIGEKHGLIALIQVVISYSIDTKWAMMMFQNDIQNGYDLVYNDKNPSIVREDFSSKTKTTIGKRQQEYENVHIKKPDPAPY